MVVDGDRQALLGLVLADDVGVEEIVALPRLGQAVPLQFGRLGQLFLDDLVTQVDALVADIDARAGNELFDLLLAFSTERALQQVTAIADACHPVTPSSRCPPRSCQPAWCRINCQAAGPSRSS